MQPNRLNQDLSGIDNFINGLPDRPSPIKLMAVLQTDPPKENENLRGNLFGAAEKKPLLSGGASASKKPASAQRRDPHDVNERVYHLKGENIKLKEKENLLETEVKMMQTKLRRIDELLRSEKTYTDTDYGRLQQELEEQFGDFKDENTVLKDRVRKLKTIFNGLSNQMGPGASVGAKPTHKPGYKAPRAASAQKRRTSPAKHHHSPGHHLHHASMNGDQQVALQEMRTLLQRNEREILKLQQQRKEQAQLSSGNLTTDDLLRKIRERDAEIRDVTHKFDDIQGNLIKREKIFLDSKAYMEEILKQINEAKYQNQALAQKNMRLHLQFSQTKSLQDNLRDLESEKGMIEQSIRRITSEPFLNRDKGSSLQRIAELEEKLKVKERLYKEVRDQEYQKQGELKLLAPEVQQLKGARDLMEKENKQLRDKYTGNAANFDEINVYSTLFKMDPTKYARAVTDMAQKPESYPIWADIDFLERPTDERGNVNPKDVKTEIQQLRFEILKLRHENKDFAAELEKAQNLLQLQRDIDRDNTKYFESEKQRLLVVERSVAAKADELARRADEKARQLAEVNRKLGISTQNLASPSKKEAVKELDNMDTQSEFSAVTHESEIRPDENVLDLVLQDAEFYFDAFKSVLDEKELLLHQKTLITFVTVDFYNHDSETSQLAEGYRPLYNTQFSFKNRVDDFYVQCLQKQTMKLDVYISKNNAAVHLGRAEIHLRELLERETAMQDVALRTPVVQKTVRVFGAPKGGKGVTTSVDLAIGSLRFKMRMRKHIGEQARLFRQNNEIENMKAFNYKVDGPIAARRKLVTVQIVGCKDMVVKYGDLTNVEPFFYYQFYDFEERYSATAHGKNPEFFDTQNFEVQYDAKMVQYLQKESLEIILFDDAAPITGIERGAQASGEQADDMIGTVLIPLADLAKGASINDRFPIRRVVKGVRQASESLGTLEAKISIMDLDIPSQTSGAEQLHQVSQQMSLHYNKQWENDLVYRISKRLARLPGDVETLFGVFARGQKSVAKEDFKYTCLKRLQLQKEVSEKELDMFLRGCARLIDREIVTLEDFLMLFSASITQARHDIMDEEAQQNQVIRAQQQQQMMLAQKSSTTLMNRSVSDDVMRGSSTNVFASRVSFVEQEINEVIQKIRSYSSMAESHIIESSKKFAVNGMISQDQFQAVVQKEGNVTSSDASRVANFFQSHSQVSLQRVEDYLKQTLHNQALQSPALQKFTRLVQTNGESVARLIINQDIDKDGLLRQEGFKAAMLAQEFAMSIAEVNEVFQLLQREGFLHYREQLIDINPSLKAMLLGSLRATNSTPSQNFRTDTNPDQALTTGRNNQSQSQLFNQRDSLNESRLSQSYNQPEDPRLRVIKNKLKQYMQQQDITLATLFKLIDTNSDSQLSVGEFKQKMKALHTPLDEGELQQLYSQIDKSQKGFIDYKMFVQEFPDINVSYMVKKMRDIIVGSKASLEGVFNEFSGGVGKRMAAADFKRLVKKYIEKAADHEIDSLFRHFSANDHGLTSGQLTLQAFTEAFGREVKDLEGTLVCSIEDIIKPLATKIKKFNVNVSQLFERYDKNHNKRLSAEELASALHKDMKLTLAEDEISAIREYFKNRHNSTEIGVLDFIELTKKKFTRTFDEAEAKRSLQLIKQRVYQGQERTAMQICAEFDVEGLKNLTLRNFKMALHSLRMLTQYQIDNLAKYLEVEDDGFVSVDRFDMELRGAHVVPQKAVQHGASGHLDATGLKRATSGRRTEKWADHK